jgi:6-phosphogluconolactonase (cycloisomerase 2 family)
MKTKHTIGITFVTVAFLLSACGGGGGGGSSSSSSGSSSGSTSSSSSGSTSSSTSSSSSGSSSGSSSSSSSGSSSGTSQSIYPRYAFVANDQDGTLSVYTVNATTGQLRHRTYVAGLGNNPRDVALDPTGKFLFVNVSGAPNGIRVFPFDATTGELGTSLFTPTGNGCRSFKFDAAGKYVYCTSGVDLRAYSIDATTGALTPLANSPYTYAAGNNFMALAMDPSGKFLFMTDAVNNVVLTYAINAVGVPLPGTAAATGLSPWGAAVDASGRYAYVANSGANSISAYSINASTGTLTPIDADGSLTGVQNFASGITPVFLAFNPAGDTLYVANVGNATISAFRLDSSTGALAHVVGSPFSVGVNLYGIAVDPSGKFLYTADSSDNKVTLYSIDAATGAIVKTSRISARKAPGAIAFSSGSAPVTYTPKAVYVANSWGNSISQFTVGADGSLSAMAPATVGTGATPVALATDLTGTYLYAAGSTAQTVSMYSLSGSGTLTPLASPTISVGADHVTIDPARKYAYVANTVGNNVGQFHILNNGELSGMITPTVNLGVGHQPLATAVDPSGRFAYVVAQGNTIYQFGIDATGALTALAPATVAASGFARAMAIHPNGLHAYVANYNDNTISQYNIAATGTLTAMSTPTVATGNGPFAMAVDQTGRYLYVTSTPGWMVSQYAIGVDGSLSPLTPATIALGALPGGLAVDVSGKYAYVAAGNAVRQFRIGSDGTLTDMPTPSVPAGSHPYDIVTTGTLQ